MWIAFDGFSDLVYLLDIAIQFRTGYLEQGLMVCDASKLAGHYLRSRLVTIKLTDTIRLTRTCADNASEYNSSMYVITSTAATYGCVSIMAVPRSRIEKQLIDVC